MNKEHKKVLDRIVNNKYYNIHDLIFDYLQLSDITKVEEVRVYQTELVELYDNIRHLIIEDLEE